MSGSKRSADFGTAFIERSVLQSLSRLWEGPLTPPALEKIELALRAFLTAPHLAVLRVSKHLYYPPADISWLHGDNEFFTPFHGDTLDYELVDPEKEFESTRLMTEELDYLTSFILRKIEQTVL